MKNLLIIVFLLLLLTGCKEKEEPSYYTVEIPCLDKEYKCLAKSHNIHSFDCYQPNGQVITIRGTYIIKR